MSECHGSRVGSPPMNVMSIDAKLRMACIGSVGGGGSISSRRSSSSHSSSNRRSSRRSSRSRTKRRSRLSRRRKGGRRRWNVISIDAKLRMVVLKCVHRCLLTMLLRIGSSSSKR